MTMERQRDEIRDAVGPAEAEGAAQDQADEQEQLDGDARHLLRGDPGDPKDRLTMPEEERLMEQQPLRDFHA